MSDVDPTLEDDEPVEPPTVEELLDLLEVSYSERDEFLDLARRTQAEFENYRKRAATQAVDDLVRATAGMVEQLLPVLDACDSALAHGAQEVEPISTALMQALEKQGLVRLEPMGEEFDPKCHEAVMHEPSFEEDDETTVVTDVMRPGYMWKGHVVRPAMVKVRG
ncbi:MAG: nucleotide exchange factor GrpE [Acidimicrobiales bacterium]|nr:nucleotide exchange factor GrpE [Acidimicrobiales bacterium]